MYQRFGVCIANPFRIVEYLLGMTCQAANQGIKI